jgi:limonene-1,2-epoxide hydrolase
MPAFHSFTASLPWSISLSMTILGALVVLLVSCQTPNQSVMRVADFQRAIAEAKATAIPKGSPEEDAAIARVTAFLSDLSPANVAATTKEVYAEDAYFNDTLKTLRGVEAIEEYLLETAHTVTSISVEFDDVARSGQDHYFRWRMDFQAQKLRKGETIRTIGITQIRFNNEGKVVLHQDFWDSTAGLFEHLPVTNQIVNAVKKRL